MTRKLPLGLGDCCFRHLQTERNLAPEITHHQLLKRFEAPPPILAMNEATRLQTGFSAAELAALVKKR